LARREERGKEEGAISASPNVFGALGRGPVTDGFGELGGCFDSVLDDGVAQEFSLGLHEETLAYRPFLRRRARTLRGCRRSETGRAP